MSNLKSTQAMSLKASTLISYFVLGLGAALFVGANCTWAPDPPSRSLDGSWAYVLQEFAGRAHFGSEIAFTYGPLGFLIANVDTPKTYPLQILAQTLLLLCLYAQLYFLKFRGQGADPISPRSVASFLVFGPVAVTFASYGHVPFPDTAVMLTCTLSIVNCIRLDTPHDRNARLVISCILATLVLVKGTLLALIGLFIILLAIRNLLSRNKSWDVHLAFFIFLIGIWLALGNSLADILRFFIAMKELASGFSPAMQTENAFHSQTRIAFLVFALMLAARYASSATRHYLDRALLGAILLAIGLVLAKHATDRYDIHVYSPAFTAIALAFSSFLLKSSQKRGAIIGLFTLLTAYPPLYIGLKSQEPNLSSEERRIWVASGGKLTKHLHDQWHHMLNLPKLLANRGHDFIDIANTLGKELPELSRSETVDLYSCQQGALLARGYNYRPRPIFQSYSAYTPWLARANLNHLQSPSAPERIFFAVDPIDQRLASMEDGLSWFEIISRYRPLNIFTLSGLQYLDLQRTGHKAEIQFGHPSFRTLNIGVWKNQPETGLVWTQGNKSNRSVLKELLAHIYKSPIYWLELELSDGQIVRRRMIEPLMETGFLLNPFVDSTLDFLSIADISSSATRGLRRVKRYRVVCGKADNCPISQWEIKNTPATLYPDPSWHGSLRLRAGLSPVNE